MFSAHRHTLHNVVTSLSIGILWLLLTACEAKPTPFPVDIPVTPTVTPDPTPIPPVRYALAPNTAGFVTDIDRIRATAQVEQLTNTVNPSDLGLLYDLVAVFGEYPGWTRTDVTPQVMFLVNPNAAPLDVQTAFLIRLSVNADEVVNALGIPGVAAADPPPDTLPLTPQEIRAEFANLGRPDGFRLALGYVPVPGADTIFAQLNTVNVETRRVLAADEQIRADLAAGRLHLAIVTWYTPEEQQAWRDLVGTDYALDLYNLPISFLAIPELTVTFTEGGWPLARR